MSERNTIPTYMKYVISGASGMAAAMFVHPLDLLKNYMQLSGMGSYKKKSVIKSAAHIYQNEGIKGFYLGLTAGLMRQVTYGSCRVGTYMWLMDSYKKKNEKTPDLHMKMLFGCAAGVVAATAGTPAEVILIRSTADSRLPFDKRRNYGNAVNAVIRIIKEEGVSALWRGYTLTIMRSVVANATELSAYSQSKHYLLSSDYFKDDCKTHVLCSTFAAFANLTFSMPVDICKTRIQNMRVVNGVPEYSGITDVLSGIIKKEGVLALWKGFTPSFLCIAPRTILIFVFIEQLSKQYCKCVLKKDCTDLASGL